MKDIELALKQAKSVKGNDYYTLTVKVLNVEIGGQVCNIDLKPVFLTLTEYLTLKTKLG